MTDWEIEGSILVNCNCSYGCPCQFDALPTHGHCRAIGAIAIEKGYFGKVPLDGLKLAIVFQWPGAVHEGRGQCQPIIDESAAPEQREALLALLSGRDSDPGATMFSVYASTMEKVYEPVVVPFDFDVDVDGRKGRVRAGSVVEIDGRPIRNPVTGSEHRVRIDLPEGFEYTLAEIGSASGRCAGPIAFELDDSYGQFARLHMNNRGPIRAARA